MSEIITNSGVKGGSIKFTKQKYNRLKDHYTRALNTKQENFMFDGYLLLTSYAKQLIDYMKPTFEG